MSELVQDRQVQRTRKALFEAFVTLVLDRRYDQLKVADIVELAGVGRSTFYEHYRGKDDLLREGLAELLGVMADVVGDGHDQERLRETLEHFWQNRRVGNVLFAGSTRTLIIRALTELIEERLAGRPAELPPSLLAAHLAGGQVALLSNWLAGRVTASAAQIGEVLRRSALAIG